MKPLLLLAALAAGCAPAVPPDPPPEAGPPALAAAPGGGLVTATVVGAGDSARVLVQPPSGPPGEAFRGAVADQNQAAPRVAVLPDGAVVVLAALEQTVEGRRFPASTLWLARSDDGGRTFGPPVRVHPDPGLPTGHTFADLAVGPRGEVVVSWLDGAARDRARREAPAAEPGGHGGHGGHGSGAGGPGTELRVAVSRDGGRTFADPVRVAAGTCECCRTALDVGPDGAVRVAWRHIFPGGERDMALATSRDGGATFAAPVRVHADRWAVDGCPHAGPAVAAGADGRVTVAWYTGAEGRAGLWAAASADGGATFSEPAALAAGAPLGQTRAARDAAGRVWLAWEDRAAGRVLVAPADAPAQARAWPGTDPALAATSDGLAVARLDGGQVRVDRR